MAEERIDSIIDIAAIKAELDTAKGGVNELVALIRSVKGTAIDISGAKSAAEFAELNKQLQINIALTNKVAQATITQATASTQVAAATQQENLSLQQNIELRKRLQNSLGSYLASQKEDLELLRAGTITRVEYNQRLTESGVRVEQYKGKISAINKEIALQTRTEKQIAIERQKNSRIEQDANNKQVAILQKSISQIQKQSSAYAILSKEYNEVSLAAKNFNLTLGAGNPLTIAATRNALRLSNQLKEVDATVGQNQKNVGNYANSITKAAGSAFGAIRKIAYVLPGIGIAGIFSAIFDGLAFVFGNTNKKADELKQTLKEIIKPLGDIKDAAVAGTTESISKIQALSNVVLDQTKSYTQRNNALNELKEINKNYFGDLTLETSKLGLLKTAVDDYTNALIAQAVVKGFEEEIGKVSVELSKQEREYNKLGKSVTDYTKTIDGLQARGIKRGAASRTQEEINDTRDALEKTTKQYNTQGGAVTKLRGQMDELKTAMQDAVNESLKFKPLTDTKTGGKKEPKGRDLTEADRKAEFELQKQRLEFIIETNKKIAEDTTASLEDRLEATREFYKASGVLIDISATFERETAGKTKKEILVIDEKAGIDRLKLEKVFFDLRVKARDDFNKAFHKDEEKLQEGMRKIADEANKDFFKDLNDRQKAEKDAAEKRIKDAEDEAKKKAELQQQLASEITTLTFTVLTANLERQKNGIQEQIDLLDKKKEKDIEVAAQTGASADDIAKIEARAAAQKEALQRKQRDLDIKKAQFDKIQSIARIVQESAIQIVKNIASPLLPLIIAIAAAQLATVIATPIPRYKQGGEHKGGLMIVGDGNKSEGITLPDGTVLKSPATSTLMTAPEGTKIHPDFNKMMLTATMTKPVEFNTKAVSDTSVKIVSGLKAVERAISKIPQTSITVASPLKQRIRYGHSINDHITRNLGK